MYTASVENKGASRFVATTKDGEFVMGQGGVGAIDAMLASLCGCVGFHVRDRLMEKKIAFSSFTIMADGGKSADGSFINRIAMTLHVESRALTAAEKEDLLAQAKTCPIYNTLAKVAEIAFSLS